MIKLYFDDLIRESYEGGLLEIAILAEILNINIQLFSYDIALSDRIIRDELFTCYGGSDTTIHLIKTKVNEGMNQHFKSLLY